MSNLKLKVNNIRINETNQNDIIKLIGSPVIKDVLDKNLWTYFEVRINTNFFGKKNIILNDVLILKFNNSGLLSNYELYDINSLNNLKFDNHITKSSAMDTSTIKKLLSSTKKRLEMLQNKSNSDNKQFNEQ